MVSASFQQTFQLSVLKMSEIGHNNPPKAGSRLPIAGSHLGGCGGMPPRKNFENLSPWNAIFCIFRKDLQNSKGSKMSYKISKVTLFFFGRNYSKFRPLLSKFSTFLYCSSVTTNWHLQLRFFIYNRPYTWIFYGILQGHNGHIYSVGKLHAWQREKVVSMRVSVRNISNACVSRKMRESWKVCFNELDCSSSAG